MLPADIQYLLVGGVRRMDGYRVDISELKRVEHLIRELGAVFAAGSSTRYSMNPSEIKNLELAAALELFHDQSRHATDLLAGCVTEVADRLQNTAGNYRDRDQEFADRITGMNGR